MANGKELGLATEREFNAESGLLTITVNEVEKVEGEAATPTGKSFTVEVDFDSLAGEAWRQLSPIGQAGLEFGLFTQYRNATGGRSLSEAQERMQAVLSAHEAGEWTSRRATGMGGMPFGPSATWAEALSRVYPSQFADSAAAAAWLNSQINLDDYRKADDEMQGKLRKAVRDHIKGDAKVRKAEADVTQERAAKRAAKAGGGQDKPLFG